MNLAELGAPEFWARWFAIVILNLTLSGDNALVIALAVRHLPRRQAWQGRLWGTLGAVVLRVLFTGMIAFLFRVPLLQAVGGAVLLWIAMKLLVQKEGDREVRHGTTLFEAVGIIIVADLVMSLDNVLAVAAAAHGDMLLITVGVSLSIPIVIWGSGLLVTLMARFAWIVDIGAGILGWVAGEMILGDELIGNRLGAGGVEALHWVLPAVLGAGVIVGGRWVASRRAPTEGTRAASRQ